MRILPSARYIEQLQELKPDIRLLLDTKIRYAAENPSRCKRLRHERPLFVIKFSDRRDAKRLILEVEHDIVRPLCILNRKYDYNNLDVELRRIERQRQLNPKYNGQ